VLFFIAYSRVIIVTSRPPTSLADQWTCLSFLSFFSWSLCNLFSSTVDSEFLLNQRSLSLEQLANYFDWRLAQPCSIYCSASLKRAPDSCWVRSAYLYLLCCSGVFGFWLVRARIFSSRRLSRFASIGRSAGSSFCPNRKWGLRMYH